MLSHHEETKSAWRGIGFLIHRKHYSDISDFGSTSSISNLSTKQNIPLENNTYNAQVGYKNDAAGICVRNFGYGKRNRPGSKLLDFLLQH